MSLQALLDGMKDFCLTFDQDGNMVKTEVTEERIIENIDAIRDRVAFYRAYPDLLIDLMKGPDSTFNLYFYQRVFLRIAMRHRYVYATFPRAFSKSFLSMMILMLRAILYPGSALFVTTGGKEQAASITIAKIEEICRLIPAMANEIDWSRGASSKGKDNVKYIFKNGSTIDILAARESSRGQRRTAGLMEEAILIDKDALNEIVIPTTNVDRLLPDGTRDPKETVNKSQIFITTAGWKNSFAYAKLLEFLISSIIFPDEYMVMGGTYKLPVYEGLLNEDFVDELKLAGSFDETSFGREYGSIWAGDSENAFFSTEVFDKNRVLLQPEYEYSGRSSKSAYYVLGVDVGRLGCTTEICVFKVTPQPQGAALKTIVNFYTYDAEHFEIQAINLKKLYYKYKARAIAIDANGVGAGLVDFMVVSQIDPDTGDTLPPFGVSNDEKGTYKKFKTEDMEKDAMWLIKANAPINTEIYTYVQTQMSSGKVKFLIDEREAKAKLMSTKVGQEMSPEQRNERLIPYQLTSILKEQMANLVQENDGVNIILKQYTRSIKKDKFSAFGYGLYFIKNEEERKKKRKSSSLCDLLFFS